MDREGLFCLSEFRHASRQYVQHTQKQTQQSLECAMSTAMSRIYALHEMRPNDIDELKILLGFLWGVSCLHPVSFVEISNMVLLMCRYLTLSFRPVTSKPSTSWTQISDWWHPLLFAMGEFYVCIRPCTRCERWYFSFLRILNFTISDIP